MKRKKIEAKKSGRQMCVTLSVKDFILQIGSCNVCAHFILLVLTDQRTNIHHFHMYIFFICSQIFYSFFRSLFHFLFYFIIFV